jgi:3-dehydroquinate synthase
MNFLDDHTLVLPITISYQLSSADPSEWYRWPESKEPLAYDSIEPTLGLADGTLCILERAFRHHLPRSSGWIIPSTEQQAYRDAAKIYRRGVACKSETDTNKIGPFGRGSYDIQFFACRASLFAALADQKKCVFIVDQAVNDQIPEVCSPRVCVSHAESAKTLDGARSLASNPTVANAEEIIVIGGGALADLAAFVASCRKIPFRFVPTTLLAMVDACVGGKTGVNHPVYGKNQIGLFAFPKAVYVETSWLDSLSYSDYDSGAAEAMKHCYLQGPSQFASSIASALARRKVSAAQLRALIEVKAKVIEQDPLEKDMRVTLNFGHTFGHALETLSLESDPIKHGQAVAFGMIFALELSRLYAGLADSMCRDMIVQISDACHLSASLKHHVIQLVSDRWEDLHKLMSHDKKNISSNSVSFVLLKNIGEVSNPNKSFTHQVSTEELAQCRLAFLRRLA